MNRHTFSTPLELTPRCQTKVQNVDCGGHPEFVEGEGKPTHMFRCFDKGSGTGQAQHDLVWFGLVS